jgi:FixJ family two-component response regulator
MSAPKPLVFIVDDDISVRDSIGLLVQTEGWQVEVFPDASTFLEHEHGRVPSCLILDVNLPGLNGLELQQQISVQRPEMPIIFITGYGDVPTTVQAMKAGAVEFLQKPFAEDVLLDAVRGALERSEVALQASTAVDKLRQRYEALSQRERQVMQLIVSGLLNKQVGGELGISEITVKAHRGRVMQKMEARSFADLVKMAATLGLQTGASSGR